MKEMNIRSLLSIKETELADLEIVRETNHIKILEVRQKIVDLQEELRHYKTKIPYCPSCGRKCSIYYPNSVLFRCTNRNCEDYLTEWEWGDSYHGQLRRH